MLLKPFKTFVAKETNFKTVVVKETNFKTFFVKETNFKTVVVKETNFKTVVVKETNFKTVVQFFWYGLAANKCITQELGALLKIIEENVNSTNTIFANKFALATLRMQLM